MELEIAAVVISALSAVGAWTAVWYAQLALNPSKAAVLSEWLSQFSHDDMRKDMGRLRAWHNEHGTAFAARYREAIRERANESTTLELLSSRRRVSQFFKNLARLHRTGLIEDRLIAKAFGKRPFDFCLEVLEPLDQAHSSQVVNEPDDTYWRQFYQRIRSKAYELDVV